MRQGWESTCLTRELGGRMPRVNSVLSMDITHITFSDK